MPSRENPPSTPWTYQMEVSPTGQAPGAPSPIPVASASQEPIPLLQALVTLQAQVLETQKLILQTQQQQLEMIREGTQIAREQRARQMAELDRWQVGHEAVLDRCRDSLGQLEQVHAALMTELVDHVADNHDNLVDGEYALTDFVDRFGPRLAHINTMLAVLRPLAIPRQVVNGGNAPGAKPEGQQS